MKPGLRTTTTTALAAACVLLAASTSVASNATERTEPADFGEPTAEQIADSIHVWDPTGHVEVIETESTDGDETVLSLDSDILFAFGSSEMPSSATSRISELVAGIPEGAAVSVTGHTDDVGTDADNLELSKDRAATVAAAVTAARRDLVLTVEGRGESDPVESNSEPEGREANRRVEIRYGG
jgi:outer membrane protein OmpA-like peptidoglycan-associated protein